MFKSYKSRCIAHSVQNTGTIAFSDMSDYAFARQHQLQQAMQIKILIHLMVDSNDPFSRHLIGSRNAEYELIIDIVSTREAYQSREIDKIRLSDLKIS